MDIRLSTSQAALLDVFRTGRITRDSIAEYELVAAWARIGLRWGDLQEALNDLTHRGLVAMRGNDRHLRVVLTRAGWRAIEARQGELLQRMTDWCRLQWLRLDTLPPPEPMQRRSSSWLMVVAAAVAGVLTLTSPAARAQAVLAPYTLCAVIEAATCGGTGAATAARAAPSPVPARDDSAAFLQWAVAAHRSAVRDAGLAGAVRPVGPATAIRVGAERQQASARRVACSP